MRPASLERAIRNRVRGVLLQQNLRALELGLSLGRSLHGDLEGRGER
ncbi:MAG: hypothetical protein N0A24_09605 [Armatimonadetes bacterium]|nr:hypothetical protein [Armatimonadota bacterium]MDW8154434.1 hypothetical protein [Armatimonadota bacterium]